MTGCGIDASYPSEDSVGTGVELSRNPAGIENLRVRLRRAKCFPGLDTSGRRAPFLRSDRYGVVVGDRRRWHNAAARCGFPRFDIRVRDAIWASIRQRAFGKDLGPTSVDDSSLLHQDGVDGRWSCKNWSAAESPVCNIKVPFAPTAGCNLPNFNVSNPTSCVDGQQADLISARRTLIMKPLSRLMIGVSQ